MRLFAPSSKQFSRSQQPLALLLESIFARTHCEIFEEPPEIKKVGFRSSQPRSGRQLSSVQLASYLVVATGWY